MPSLERYVYKGWGKRWWTCIAVITCTGRGSDRRHDCGRVWSKHFSAWRSLPRCLGLSLLLLPRLMLMLSTRRNQLSSVVRNSSNLFETFNISASGLPCLTVASELLLKHSNELRVITSRPQFSPGRYLYRLALVSDARKVLSTWSFSKHQHYGCSEVRQIGRSYLKQWLLESKCSQVFDSFLNTSGLEGRWVHQQLSDVEVCSLSCVQVT